MAIPDFQSIMLPFLKIAGDRQEHRIREAIGTLAEHFKLSEEERKELLPSGQQTIFDNRSHWTRMYLKKAGLIESPRRGFFKITQRGIDFLAKNPSELNTKTLRQFPEFVEFQFQKKENKETQEVVLDAINEQTPEESLEYSYQRLRSNLTQELLSKVKTCSPQFFENLVIELLVKMGYGGSRKDAGKAIGKSGDEGIDGIIKEDKLGLDIIYIQAKRWEGSVGRPEIHKFVGALQGQRAKKGVFITTGVFTKDALEYVKSIDNKVVLIDGELLTQLMLDHDIGVSKVAAYEMKKIDSDYFEEE